MDIYEICAPIKEDIEEIEVLLSNYMKSDEPHLYELFNHMQKFHGKRIRPILLLLSAKISGNYTDIHKKLGVVIELIHNASLIHDDILDEALIRRNIPTFNKKWGNEISVLFGDYLFALAFKICSSIGDNGLLKILSNVSQEMCQGELVQTCLRLDNTITEEAYLEIIRKKTGALFEAACKLGAYNYQKTDTYKALTKYGNYFGLAFQIVDDYLDIVGNESKMKKTLGTDMEKGKATLPLIKLFQVIDDNERAHYTKLFKEHNFSHDILIEALEKYGILSYPLEQAEHYISLAKKSIENIDNCDYKEILIKLADFVLYQTANEILK